MKKRIIVIFSASFFLLSGCHNAESSNVHLTSESQITTTETISIKKSDEIPFKQINAFYNDTDIENSPELREKLNQFQSCIILNADMLKNNLNQPLNSYTEQFFENHALIYVAIKFANTSLTPPTVTKLSLDGNILTIHATRKDALDEAHQWWCTFFEVNKKDIHGIDKNAVFAYDIIENNLGNVENGIILS